MFKINNKNHQNVKLLLRTILFNPLKTNVALHIETSQFIKFYKCYSVIGRTLMFSVSSHCVKSVQIRSYFWSVFSRIQYRKIRTRNNSVFGHFSRSDRFVESDNLKVEPVQTFQLIW